MDVRCRNAEDHKIATRTGLLFSSFYWIREKMRSWNGWNAGMMRGKSGRVVARRLLPTTYKSCCPATRFSAQVNKIARLGGWPGSTDPPTPNASIRNSREIL